MNRRAPTPDLSHFLCFDFGLRHIGVASGQRITGTATPLEVITIGAGDGHWQRIEQLLSKWQPHALVVGVPLTVEGERQPMTRHARRFAEDLRSRSGLPVFEADERFSSREAQARFRLQRQAGAARQRAARFEDAVAAQVILEGWFAELSA